MKTKLISLSLTFLALLSTMGMPAVSLGHEGDCPYCKLPLVQNSKEQDNEVVVKFGNKRIEYRCVYCVFKDQKRYKSDLVVYAPSGKVGEPVVLKRTDGKWSAPEGAVFLNTFRKHSECAELSRAFSSKAVYEKYVADKKIVDAKPLSLSEFLEMVMKPIGVSK